jgi:hypothetical protein
MRLTNRVFMTLGIVGLQTMQPNVRCLKKTIQHFDKEIRSKVSFFDPKNFFSIDLNTICQAHFRNDGRQIIEEILRLKVG